MVPAHVVCCDCSRLHVACRICVKWLSGGKFTQPWAFVTSWCILDLGWSLCTVPWSRTLEKCVSRAVVFPIPLNELPLGLLLFYVWHVSHFGYVLRYEALATRTIEVADILHCSCWVSLEELLHSLDALRFRDLIKNMSTLLKIRYNMRGILVFKQDIV